MVGCGAGGGEGVAAAGVVEAGAGELDGDDAGVLGVLTGAGASVGGACTLLYTTVVATGTLCSSTYTITSAASTVTTSTSVTTACLRWC